MDILLIFFAFPIAVIIISAILQKILKSPIAVAALIFAVFLIVTFTAFDETFLIATLAYTLIALITASIVNFLKRDCENEQNLSKLISEIIRNNCNDNTESTPNTVEDLINNTSNNCSCNRYRRR